MNDTTTYHDVLQFIKEIVMADLLDEDLQEDCYGELYTRIAERIGNAVSVEDVFQIWAAFEGTSLNSTYIVRLLDKEQDAVIYKQGQ